MKCKCQNSSHFLYFSDFAKIYGLLYGSLSNYSQLRRQIVAVKSFFGFASYLEPIKFELQVLLLIEQLLQPIGQNDVRVVQTAVLLVELIVLVGIRDLLVALIVLLLVLLVLLIFVLAHLLVAVLLVVVVSGIHYE